MIYYGCRSHQNYLDRLRLIAKGDGPHRIVSVAGGCAFLHALRKGADSITIIDNDQENLQFCAELLVKIGADLDTPEKFLSYVTSVEYAPAGKVNTDGIDLTHGVFNWTKGLGFLESEEAYKQMRDAVWRGPVYFEHADLTKFDFATETPIITEFLASNVDSPLFTVPGALLTRVLATAKYEVRYHSWIVDAILKPAGLNY